MTSKLVSTYDGIIKAAGLLVSLDGSISMRTATGSKPFEIAKQRLVLPNAEQLAKPDWSKRVLFNPLSENFARGETPIMTRYRRTFIARIEVLLSTIIGWQLTTAGAQDGKLVKQLSPAQAAFTAVLDDQTSKYAALATKFAKMKENIDKAGEIFWFINTSMAKNGTVNGVKCNRACIVTFPFYELLLEGETKHFGVTFNKFEVKTLIELLQFVVPGIGTVVYNHGSMSMMAPTIDAFMGTAKLIGAVTDKLQDLYADLYEDTDRVLHESWTSTFEDLSVVAKEVRDLGNTDATIDEPVAQTPQAPRAEVPKMVVQHNTPVFQTAPQQHQAQPVMTPPPVAAIPTAATPEKMTFAEAQAYRARMQQQAQQLAYQQQQQQPYQGGYNYGQAPAPQPNGRQVIDGWGPVLANDARTGQYGYAQPQHDQWGRPLQQQQQLQYDHFGRPITTAPPPQYAPAYNATPQYNQAPQYGVVPGMDTSSPYVL